MAGLPCRFVSTWAVVCGSASVVYLLRCQTAPYPIWLREEDVTYTKLLKSPLCHLCYITTRILETRLWLHDHESISVMCFFCRQFFIVNVCLHFVRFLFCEGFPQENGKWIHKSLVWKSKNLLSKSKHLRATSAWTHLTFYLITVANVRTLALHKGTWTMFVERFIQRGELTPEPWQKKA